VQWSQGKANVSTAEASNRDVSRTVALAVARAYLAVVSQKRVVEINARALATDHAHYDYTHIRLVGGVGNRVDDVRAAQQVASDEAQLETSYTGLARAREALAVLVGEAQPMDVYDDVALASSSADPRQRSRNDKDIAAAKARVRLAEKVKRESWADYTPSLVGQFIPFYQNHRPSDTGNRLASTGRAQLSTGGRRPAPRAIPGARSFGWPRRAASTTAFCARPARYSRGGRRDPSRPTRQ